MVSCFDYNDPADSFVITDDFVSAGRISGAKKYSHFEAEGWELSSGREKAIAGE